MLPIAILAGGLATRLRPLTNSLPKALIKINGDPFLSHQLRLLKSRGLERVVLCVGFLGEMIRSFAQDGKDFGLSVEYSWDGLSPLGTAGAIRHALPLLGEAFFVTYGDSYLPCDYQAIEDAFLTSGKQALMTVFENNGQWDTSNVELVDGQIVAHNKALPIPTMRHIDYGLGVFSRSSFAECSLSSELSTVYQELIGRNELASFIVGERFYEIGSADGILALSEMKLRTP